MIIPKTSEPLMNSLNSIASIALAIFLIGVSVQGNGNRLVELAKRDIEFLQWAGAFIFLYYLSSFNNISEPVRVIIYMTYVGFVMKNFDNIKKGATDIFNAAGGASRTFSNGEKKNA